MASRRSTNVIGPNGECTECGQPHHTHHGAVSCAGHVRFDRDPESSTYRQRLPQPRPCKASPRPGLDRCPKHGAGAAKVAEVGRRRVTEQKARTVLAQALRDAYGDDIPDVPPAEAMLHAVSWTYAEVKVLRQIVAGLDADERVWGVTREKSGGDDHGTTEEARPNIWWTMLTEAKRDLVKFSAAARAAGCDEARVKIAERTGQMFASVIRAILGDLNLTAEQQDLVSTVVPRHLRAVAN